MHGRFITFDRNIENQKIIIADFLSTQNIHHIHLIQLYMFVSISLTSFFNERKPFYISPPYLINIISFNHRHNDTLFKRVCVYGEIRIKKKNFSSKLFNYMSFSLIIQILLGRRRNYSLISSSFLSYKNINTLDFVKL